VIHRPDQARFEIEIDAHVAVLNYTREGETIIFTHTGVPRELEGRGIGSHLAKTGLDYAREHHLKVTSVCWFVTKYIDRHPEYQVLLK
jgi:predicted GNAT family acetyltransferase